jgi:hypothetical protein
LGLKIIVEPTLSPESSTPSLNIIFVHGLGGSSDTTWTDPETNAFWPIWLSKVKGLENSRIMTFGYDSGWNKIWKANNVLDISDFAKQLVHDLWSYDFDNGDVTSCICFNLISHNSSSSLIAWVGWLSKRYGIK